MCAVAKLVLALTAVTVNASLGGSQAPPPTPDHVLDSAVATGFTGFALVRRDNKTAFAKGYGWANPAGRVPFTQDTPIEIASITKIFTKAAILRLEQDGRLATSDPAGKYLPSLPADKSVITLQQLLDMRGGFREYHERENDSLPSDHQRMSKAEALQRIGGQTLLFAPGSAQRYSNSGYTLLAAVVEAASGMSFERYVHQHLLTPAGMSATGFYGEGKWKAGSASRAAGRPAYLDNAPERWPAVSWVLEGSGGMISTPRDLTRWIDALHSGKILSAAQLRKQYAQPDWAFYAGGNSIGFETDVIELDGGADLVILHTNSGLGRVPLAARLAEWASGGPLPTKLQDIVRQIGNGPQVVTGGGSQAPGGSDRVVRQGPPPAATGAATDPVRTAAQAFMRAMRDGSDATLRSFVSEWLSDAAQREMPLDARVTALSAISKQVIAAALLNVAPAGPNAAQLTIDHGDGKPTLVQIDVAAEAPFRIVRITPRTP
jgi:CubicO group peptidase (beta-lactamase class C family)